MRCNLMIRIQATLVLCAALFSASSLLAQDEATPPAEKAKPQAEKAEAAKPQAMDPTSVLDEQQWKEVDESINRALKWLATQQEEDGSFPSIQNGQPGVTGLCMMAFLSQGHIPGEGEYGDQLKRALDFMISCQNRNGMLAAAVPDRENLSRAIAHQPGYSSVYNHAIAGLVLSECYAMVGPDQTALIKPIIEKALEATCQMQDFRKDRKADDEGGWRYLHDFDGVDSDLSVTGWQLMFLRSAKNAGFDVQEERIARALKYVHRCYIEERGTFSYKVGFRLRTSRGMAGAGILALAHAGLHESPKAQKAGDYILKSGFHQYNELGKVQDYNVIGDRYHYGLLICSQAMYQLGGRHWREFFPPVAQLLIAKQKDDGSWPPEKIHKDAKYGNAYTTAVGVLSLSATNDLLPIFQR